jgi:hypothetical protein
MHFRCGSLCIVAIDAFKSHIEFVSCPYLKPAQNKRGDRNDAQRFAAGTTNYSEND